MIKRLITVLICFLITLLVYLYQDDISMYVIQYVNDFRVASYIETTSEYTKNRDYKFVSKTDDFVPHNYQDLLNMIYTSLDNRYETVTFYCPRDYIECIEDVIKISSEGYEDKLTMVGNLLAPYNNYSNINVTYDTTGAVTYDISYLYDDDMIKYTNEEIDNIFNSIINDNMTLEEKITALHDYVIEYAEYDVNYEQELEQFGKGKHPSNTAYGLLKYKLAVCSGYSDIMALMLDRLGVENYKVASETHIWNLAIINGKYLHIDLTWDDPLNNIYNEKIQKYLMIDTPTLLKYDPLKHNFDRSVYLEIQ